METNIQNQKQLEVKRRIEKYLEKTSAHLFFNQDMNYVYKIIPFRNGQELLLATIKISKDENRITSGNYIDVSIRTTSDLTESADISFLKRWIFPQYTKHKSIRRNRELQDKFNDVKDFLNKNSNLDKNSLIVELKKFF